MDAILSKKQASLELILSQGMLPLYFHPDADVSAQVLRALYSEGVRAVEYTNRGEEALANFAHLLQLRNAEMPGLQLGIGTIKTGAQALAYVAAGADFLVSPGLVPDVAAIADQAGLLWVPGCMTSTEIIAAEALGATFVKLFPGSLLGPSYVGTIRELFPSVRFMPTGGVEVDEINLREWFRVGVSAVGMGSKLISKSALDARDYVSIGAMTRKAFGLIKEARSF